MDSRAAREDDEVLVLMAPPEMHGSFTRLTDASIMMRGYRYLAVLAGDPDGGVIVTFPDVQEANTFGEDRGDALRSAAEGLGLALRGYLADGGVLPDAVTQGDEMVSPYADDVLKLAVVESFRKAEVSASEFARMARLKPWKVEALIDPDAVNAMAEMGNALTILGRRLRITVEAAYTKSH